MHCLALTNSVIYSKCFVCCPGNERGIFAFYLVHNLIYVIWSEMANTRNLKFKIKLFMSKLESFLILFFIAWPWGHWRHSCPLKACSISGCLCMKAWVKLFTARILLFVMFLKSHLRIALKLNRIVLAGPCAAISVLSYDTSLSKSLT